MGPASSPSHQGREEAENPIHSETQTQDVPEGPILPRVLATFSRALPGPPQMTHPGSWSFFGVCLKSWTSPHWPFSEPEGVGPGPHVGLGLKSEACERQGLYLHWGSLRFLRDPVGSSEGLHLSGPGARAEPLDKGFQNGTFFYLCPFPPTLRSPR